MREVINEASSLFTRLHLSSRGFISLHEASSLFTVMRMVMKCQNEE
jgi:hypothetical protein